MVRCDAIAQNNGSENAARISFGGARGRVAQIAGTERDMHHDIVTPSAPWHENWFTEMSIRVT